MTQRVDVLAFAARQRNTLTWVRLGNAPDDWKVLRQKMRNLRRLLLRRDIPTDYFWTAEPYKNGGLHVHALMVGKIPQKPLSAIWGSQTHVQPTMPSEARNVTKYMLKEAFTDLSAHLSRNGHRGEHHTRGFLGADLQTTTAAFRVEQGIDHRTWHLEPGWTIPAAA